MITKISAAICSLGCLLTLGGSGCSTFNRDWKASARTAVPTNDIQGPWDGDWLSQTRGHHGRLRCLMTKTAEGRYDARFHAKFWKIFSFGYTVPFAVQQSDSSYRFQGDADLGKLAGGLYHYEGQATPTNFNSTYSSKADQGIFQMKRPNAAE